MESFFNFSEIRTQPVYYTPYVFSEYEIIEIATAQGDRPYITGKGRWITASPPPIDPYYSLSSYEDFLQQHKLISDGSFLQCALSTGYRLLDKNGNRAKFDTDGDFLNPLWQFIDRYGLDNPKLALLTPVGAQEPVRRIGCDLFAFVNQLQDLAIAHKRLSVMQINNLAPQEEEIARSTVTWCNATIRSVCLYNPKTKLFHNVLVVNSLIDLANFQYSQVIANRVYMQKCANPSCPVVIIGGRSDRKTCSNSCRKAVERFNKRKAGGTNGDDKKA